MDQDFLDQIYECSFAPELWPAVLDRLASIADAHGGFLFTANDRVLKWTASQSMIGSMERCISGDWLRRGRRFGLLAASRHAGFLTEDNIYADAEQEADPFYRDFLYPAGFGWGVGMVIPLPTGDSLALGLERRRQRGPVEATIVQQLDLLRPHLARSLLLSARLQLERAQIASDTLARIGLPALVIDERGKVLATNHLIEALTTHLRWRARDRVAFKDGAVDSLFRQAIETLDLEGQAPVRSFAVRAAAANAAMVAHVVPIRRTARDVFVRCAAMLVLTPVALPHIPPVELVRSLFDLSPAEARVARHLVGGSTVGEIASVDGVSNSTVRTQVRGVLEKTGCRRQAEVVALLGGIALAPG